MLETIDEKGPDEKVIAIPVHEVENTFENWNTIDDVPKNTLNYVEHFFKYYKCNEKDKWVNVGSFVDKEKTINFIEKSRV